MSDPTPCPHDRLARLDAVEDGWCAQCLARDLEAVQRDLAEARGHIASASDTLVDERLAMASLRARVADLEGALTEAINHVETDASYRDKMQRAPASVEYLRRKAAQWRAALASGGGAPTPPPHE